MTNSLVSEFCNQWCAPVIWFVEIRTVAMKLILAASNKGVSVILKSIRHMQCFQVNYFVAWCSVQRCFEDGSFQDTPTVGSGDNVIPLNIP